MPEPSITVDVAGGQEGGASRYRTELDRYLVKRRDIEVIGQGRYLTPAWLARRELEASAPERIALNNASFLRGRRRSVLLHNALHFADRSEMDALDFVPSRALRAQVPIIRNLTLRATEVIVPCSAMKERVLKYLPSVEDRLVVKFHPIGQLVRHPDKGRFRILMPIVNTPYKQLEHHVRSLLQALNVSGIDALIHMTGAAQDYPADISGDPRTDFIGILPPRDLESYWQEVGAIYFPTKLEAFGFPLAEARVHGVPVLAIESEQSRELAGDALCAFSGGSIEDLAAAVLSATVKSCVPDPMPFDPKSYFDWMLGVGR